MDPSLRLRWEHSLRTALKQYTAVATLTFLEQKPDLKMILPADDSVVVPSLLHRGIWEANETHWISSFISEGDIVVDVGAHVGYYTLIFARLVGPTGRVYAFEPEPTNYGYLEKNIRLNDFENVVLEQKALSNATGTLKLFLDDHNTGAHSMQTTRKKPKFVEVEAVTFDDYFEDIGPIDFVKVDTEGAEFFILSGMKRSIESNDGIRLAVEVWPHALQGLGVEFGDYLDLLRSYDFRFFDLGPSGQAWTAEIPEVNRKALKQRLTTENRKFTNLLLAKGLADVTQLRAVREQKRAALWIDTPELEGAQAAWEQSLLAETEAAPGEPFTELQRVKLSTALRTPISQRSDLQSAMIDDAFRATTDLLKQERSEFEAAHQAIEAANANAFRP